jgi:hypothetical protein
MRELGHSAVDASLASVARDGLRGDSHAGHPPLEPALASVLAQGPPELRGLNPRLKLTNSLAQARRLAVYGILKALHELLDLSYPSLERT